MKKPTFQKKKTSPAHSKGTMQRIRSGKSMIASNNTKKS